MKRKTVSVPNFSDLQCQSVEILAQNGNRLRLMGAWMLGMIFVPLYMLLWQALMLLPKPLFGLDNTFCFTILAVLLTLFALMPYLYGILQMARLMASGEETVLADVFLPFSSPRAYGKAVRVSFGVFWKLWLIFDIAAGICYLTATLAPSNLLAALVAGMLVVCEVLLGLVLCLFGYARVWAESQDGITWRKAAKTTRAFFRTCPAGGLWFFFVYIPRIALGLVTLGVLLLADVLPRMFVSYFRYCDMINESMIQLEENTDE